MKYSLVEITSEFQVIFRYSNMEREEIKTKPNKQRFYYFPVTMSNKEAFNKLKQFLIADIDKQIIKLLEYKYKLIKLTMDS